MSQCYTSTVAMKFLRVSSKRNTCTWSSWTKQLHSLHIYIYIYMYIALHMQLSRPNCDSLVPHLVYLHCTYSYMFNVSNWHVHPALLQWSGMLIADSPAYTIHTCTYIYHTCICPYICVTAQDYKHTICRSECLQ